MRIILLFTAILFVSCNSTTSRRTTENDEIIRQLSQNDTVRLQPKVYDFTGYKDIPVKGYFDLNGATIKCDSMLQLAFNDNHFLFILDSAATIRNGTIKGASGRTEAIMQGYFSAIKVLHSGRVDSITFLNCDKFGVYVLGDRNTLTDTTFITNCTFELIPRMGAGYGGWFQYGTVIFANNMVSRVRHGIDCGSEGNRVFVLNNTFRGCYYIPIHQHRYIGDSVGQGIVIKNNLFLDPVALTIDIGVPFSGENIIENNSFITKNIGLMGRDTIAIGNNQMNGTGIKPAPFIKGGGTYMVGERYNLSVDVPCKWNNGVTGSKVSGTPKNPSVKVFSAYTNGLSDTCTVLSLGQGDYFGFYAMSANGKIEVYSGEKLLKTIKGSGLYEYKYYLFPFPDVYLKVYPTEKVYLDNVVRSGGFYDTFEEGVKVKLKYYGTGISVSRPLINQVDGFRCLMIGASSGWVEVR
jgi:hypothetical protein